MTRYPNAFQFEQEVKDLRRVWEHYFAADAISDGLLRKLLRESKPSDVTTAIRLTHAQFEQVSGAMAFATLRRNLVRHWKTLTAPTPTPLSNGPDAVRVEGATAPSTPQQSFTKAEAAQLLGISLRTLATRMKTGAIKYTKADRRVYFTREDLGLDVHTTDVIVPAPTTDRSLPAPVPSGSDSEPHDPVSVTESVTESQEGPARTYATGWNADRSMFVSSEGTVYRRHPRSGEMYRSSERLSRCPSTSPSAADSCIRHPFSFQRSPRSTGGWGGEGQDL